MNDLVTITVDGRALEVPKGTLLWEAARAHGVEIPIFCYHTKLGPVGACRTCLVEVEGARGPVTACSTPVNDGMRVRTRSAAVEKMQRGIFEFLLANHPLDCPICDRGGECPLQDQTFRFGPGVSRYIEPKRHHVKPIALGPTIALDRERCVLCWRCVRFCEEVAEDKSIVLLDRGDHTVVGTFQNDPYVSNFSGNVIELCPVGALTSRKQRFNFRPWELQNRPSVCPHCPMGCNINISVRKNDEVIRFLSRDNPDVDWGWLCDRGRFGFEFINNPDRLASPLLRRGEAFVQVSWQEALDFTAERLAAIVEEYGPAAIAGIASPRLTNEDLFVFKRFMQEVLRSDRIDHVPRSQLFLTPDQQEAVRALDQTVISFSELESAKTILLMAADPTRREPVLELTIRRAVNKHGASLVIVAPGEIALSSKASSSLICPPEELASTLDALARAVKQGETPDAIRALADRYLVEGPIAVVYDENLEGVIDKGTALAALAGFLGALGGRAAGVLPLLDSCNSMGARDLDVFPPGAWRGVGVAEELASGSAIRAGLLLGADVVSDNPALADALRRLDLVVVSELQLTATAACADVVLPAASFAEKRGTFTSAERRVQVIDPAVPAPGTARPEWEILVDLSQYFDVALPYGRPEEVWHDIERSVTKYRGLDYSDIGPRGTRPAALHPV